MIWHIVQHVTTSYSIINKSNLINWWAILENYQRINSVEITIGKMNVPTEQGGLVLH